MFDFFVEDVVDLVFFFRSGIVCGFVMFGFGWFGFGFFFGRYW